MRAAVALESAYSAVGNTQLDALVANAGIGAGSSVEETPLETAREIFETNYFGNVSLLQAAAPAASSRITAAISNARTCSVYSTAPSAKPARLRAAWVSVILSCSPS